jgi:hypothetical protein
VRVDVLLESIVCKTRPLLAIKHIVRRHELQNTHHLIFSSKQVTSLLDVSVCVCVRTRVSFNDDVDVQVFNFAAKEFTRYLLLHFTSHYGSESICTVNNVRVFGVTETEDLEAQLEALHGSTIDATAATIAFASAAADLLDADDIDVPGALDAPATGYDLALLADADADTHVELERVNPAFFGAAEHSAGKPKFAHGAELGSDSLDGVVGQIHAAVSKEQQQHDIRDRGAASGSAAASGTTADTRGDAEVPVPPLASPGLQCDQISGSSCVATDSKPVPPSHRTVHATGGEKGHAEPHQSGADGGLGTEDDATIGSADTKMQNEAFPGTDQEPCEEQHTSEDALVKDHSKRVNATIPSSEQQSHEGNIEASTHLLSCCMCMCSFLSCLECMNATFIWTKV